MTALPRIAIESSVDNDLLCFVQALHRFGEALASHPRLQSFLATYRAELNLLLEFARRDDPAADLPAPPSPPPPAAPPVVVQGRMLR